MGGCSDKPYKLGDDCVEQCPIGYYIYDSNCITQSKCTNEGGFIYINETGFISIYCYNSCNQYRYNFSNGGLS